VVHAHNGVRIMLGERIIRYVKIAGARCMHVDHAVQVQAFSNERVQVLLHR
jgi:hypothetical protein